MIPVFIYACVYYMIVAVVGEEKGGRNEFYGFLTRIPPWISISAFSPVTFGIATVLRILHNKTCKCCREKARKQYQEAFRAKDMHEVIIHLGRGTAKETRSATSSSRTISCACS